MPSNDSELVTVVNRTSKEVQGTYDGRSYPIGPLKSVSVPRCVARNIRFQNPVMGRGTPLEEWNSKSEYLVGIVEDEDDITPIEQSSEPQRWDTVLVNGTNFEIIRPRGGGFVEVKQYVAPASEDGGFRKP